MLKKFSRYSLIGVLNTGIHWSVFALILWLWPSQALANGLGFVSAATASYWMNAKFTFQQQAHKKGYVWFMLGMGSLSVLMGYVADLLHWPGILTLVLFSATSLTLGFAWSNWWVFRPRQTTE